MAKENFTKFILLGLITTECKSGYDIKQMIDQSLSHFWKISYGQIYPNLKKLVEEGLATVTETVQEGKPDKKEYHITKAGQQLLKDWLQQPLTEFPTERNEMLLKLFFSRHQEKAVALEQVQAYKDRLTERYLVYEGIKTYIAEHESEKNDAMYWLITLDYGKKTTKAALDWCDTTIEKLKLR